MQILESTGQKQKSTDYICHTYFENVKQTQNLLSAIIQFLEAICHTYFQK